MNEENKDDQEVKPAPKDEFKTRPYRVTLKSKEFGTETFDYPDLDEAIEGISRVALAGIKIKDGVKRWFSVSPIE